MSIFNVNRSGWESLYPFTSRSVPLAESPDLILHYIDEYTGSERNPATLLFVHGNPTWSFHWRNLISALRPHYRCIAVDHLGCGLSSTPPRIRRLAERIEDLVYFIDTLQLHQITLLAQDWGGAIGFGAALACPDRFERFVLFNTGAFRPWFVPWRIRACRFPVLGRLAVQGGNAFCRAALSMTLARGPLPAAVRRGYLAPYSSWQRRRVVYDFVADIPRTSRHPTWETLAQIEARLPQLENRPFLFVWGMQDWCFTPACLAKFLDLIPSADVIRIADAGHWVVEDAADEVLRAVTAFCNSAVVFDS